MLYQACKSGDIATVSGLLVAGADPNGLLNSSSPLIAASKNAHVEMIFLLLEHMADVNSSSACRSSPLVAAVRKSSLRAVEALLDAGADPNVATSTGLTPLMVAASDGSANIVRLLLDRGALAGPVDHKGRTALHHGCQRARMRFEAIRLLLKAGAV